MQGQTYIIYTRCSTEEQRKKGNSHQYQSREIQSFADRKGMICVGTFQDTMTGTTFMGRNQLDAAYALCEHMNGEIRYLLTYKMDRFGREVGDALTAIKRFRAIGVEVNFTDEWIDYHDASHPLSLALKFALAQSESLKISERTKDGIYQSQLNGYYPFDAPPGYKKEMTNIQKANGNHLKVCVQDPEVAPIVRKIFECLSTGLYSQIELFRRYGVKIGVSRSRFYAMLKNDFYTGIISIKSYRGNPAQRVKGKHEAIISNDLFSRCQDIIEGSRRPNAGRTWKVQQDGGQGFYLKGVLRCPLSNRFMTAYQVNKKSGRQYRYYATPSGQDKVHLPVEKTHNLIKVALRDFSIDDDMYSMLREELDLEAQERSKEIKSALDRYQSVLTRGKTRLDKVSNDYADGIIDAHTFNRLRARFLSDISDNQSKINELEQGLALADDLMYRIMGMLKRIDKIYDSFGDEQKNLFLKASFPDGFCVDLDSQSVLTPKTSTIFDILGCNSAEYTYVKVKGDSLKDENPDGGGRREHFLTDLNLWVPIVVAS